MVWCCTFPVGCPHMEEPWPCAACLRAARALLRPEPRGFQIIVWYYVYVFPTVWFHKEPWPCAACLRATRTLRRHEPRRYQALEERAVSPAGFQYGEEDSIHWPYMQYKASPAPRMRLHAACLTQPAAWERTSCAWYMLCVSCSLCMQARHTLVFTCICRWHAGVHSRRVTSWKSSSVGAGVLIRACYKRGSTSLVPAGHKCASRCAKG